ncbi:MAG: long-chain-fatty-acid--CoA ligase [Rhodospirillaceae bacterium]|nr:long-chain-fatty-acid--CoA ligase [Rhodospirillaceae bacterium]
MRGRMMDWPLLISSLIEHAAQNHADAEIVSRSVEGPMHRTTYAEVNRRSKQLAKALGKLDVGFGDRVATLAWNGYRHVELYYAISGIGSVCHTVNPRLFVDQLIYIFNHAADKVLFFDLTFLPLVEKLAAQMKTVRHFVLMTDRAHMPASSPLKLLCYEELLAAEDDDLHWPRFDELTASSLCYTSGTTGNPKGALYTHRSTVIHALTCCATDVFSMSAEDSVCPIVPMFHVNGWAVPYAAAMSGTRLVMPGPALDGASVAKLFNDEGVTFSLGVPTVWLGLIKHMDETGGKFRTFKRMLVGGSAIAPSLVEAFQKRYGVNVRHGWGMSELSPVGTTGTLKRKHMGLSEDEKIQVQLKQGRALYGVEMKIVDAEGKRLPHDGKAQGELLVRGPGVVSGYFNDEEASRAALDEEGWFRTGDVGTIDTDGYLQITDRRKDVIKSGGEWISSIDIENMAIGHPDIQEAAVIGLPHQKWGERPLLIAVPKEGKTPTKEAVTQFIAGKVEKWMVPDDVVFVKELPHTATGKLLKIKLREDFKNHRLPGT